MKHPGPWREIDDGVVVDANGEEIISGGLGEENRGIDAFQDVMRLILAAPELLDALKAVCDHMGVEDTEAGQDALALIARIEGAHG